jgi:hypothetical protein
MNIDKNPLIGETGDFAGSKSYEDTLRLIAGLHAPEGLEERVQVGLHRTPHRSAGKAQILSWPTMPRMDNSWMRFAAAAAIACVVAGGGWGIYSRVRPAQAPTAVTIPQHIAPQGGFSSAGAMRTPQTLDGPVLKAPAFGSNPASVAPPTAKAAQPHHGTVTTANKAVAEPAASATK